MIFLRAKDVKMALPEKSEEPAKFQIIAYTGAPVELYGFEKPVIIDMDGIEFAKSVTLRLEHDPGKVVGHCTRCAVENGTLIAEGVISRVNRDADDVAKSGKNGFPWQASVGGPVLDSIELGTEEELTVNGRVVKGCMVVTKFLLQEISFVAAGADENTEAIRASNKNESMEEIEMGKTIEEMRSNAAAESLRIASINKLDGDGEIKAKAILDGWTPEKAELEMLRAARAVAPAVRSERNEEFDSSVLECVALKAAGVPSERLEKKYGEKTLEAAYKNRGMGLQEFICAAASERLPQYRSDASGFIRAAFSTASVSGILSNVANKALQEGYLFAEESWRDVCKITSVPDFKTAYRYRLDPDFSFKKVAAGGELTHGTLEDANYTNKAETYGVMFSIDRQMIINDDLGALTEIPKQIGIAASESIAEAVWSLFLSNPSDFFSAGHKNYVTGSSYALSIAGLDKAYSTFMAQTKKNKKPLGAVPTILLVPGCLAMTAEQINKSLTLNDGSAKATGVANPFCGKFKVVASSYLDNSSISGYSATAYYLFADPQRIPTIEVAFLNGNDRPVVEQAQANFETLGIQFRGYADYGVALGDWRGAVKMTGAN